MGVVQRQGFKHSLLRFIGVAIGAISTLFIFPLNRELYGFAHFLLGTAFLLTPFANWGIVTLSVKFFPRFNEDKKLGHAFFNKLWVYSLSIFVVFAIAMFLIKPSFIGLLKRLDFSEVGLFDEYYGVILVLTLTTILIALCRQQGMNFKRIVVPSALIDFSLKVFLPVCVIVSLYWTLTFDHFSLLLIMYHILAISGLLFYLRKIGAFSFFYSRKLFEGRLGKKELINFATFSSFSRLGTVVAFRIDAFMITLMLGAASNGLYYIFLFMANTIQIPFQSINQIASPIISGAWQRNDLEKISVMYKKSALVLLILVSSLFMFLYFSLEEILSLSPRGTELKAGISLFLFLGLARLSDSVTSINESILSYSKYYKYNVVFILGLAFANVILNYFLIREFGLVGAAISTMVAYSLFNLVKLLFIYRKFKIHPLSKPMLMALPLLIATTALLYYLPEMNNIFLGLSANATLILILVFIPLLRWRVSEDLNDIVYKILKKMPILSKFASWVK